MRKLSCLARLGLSTVALLSPARLIAAPDLNAVLARTSEQVVSFLDQFSEVKCTEHVMQEKTSVSGKVLSQTESTYDYLVIMTNAGGELSLDESRLEVGVGKRDKKQISLLTSNGFATLFVIFHPYYSGSFRFSDLGEAAHEGRTLRKIGFAAIPGTRSPAALSLRGHEYPLALSGVGWIDAETGIIVQISADVGTTMQDVGLESLRAEVRYAPVTFRDTNTTHWYPLEALVEAGTLRQHWKNTHRFTDYKRFSVSTEEQVAKQ